MKKTTEQNTRQAILNAAAKIFATNGYAAATTRAIASEAKVNLALINYHFFSKEELYRATVEMLFEDLAKPMMALPDRVTDAESWEKALRSWVRQALALTGAEEPPQLWCARLMAQENCLPSAMAEDVYQLFAVPVYDSLRQLIRMGMGDPDDYVTLNLMFNSVVGQGMVYALHTKWERLLKPAKISRKLWLRYVADYTVDGLLAKLKYQGSQAEKKINKEKGVEYES